MATKSDHAQKHGALVARRIPRKVVSPQSLTPFRQTLLVDGTTNFVHGLPYFCVSAVGYTENRIPQLGAVATPALGAAGALIAEGAGGRATDIWGSDDNILFAGNVLTANPAVHRFFLELNA